MKLRKERINFFIDAIPKQNLDNNPLFRSKDEIVYDYENYDFYEKLEQQYPLISERGYVVYLKNDDEIRNYLHFFSKISLYFTIPTFILKNEVLMKSLSQFAN